MLCLLDGPATDFTRFYLVFCGELVSCAPLAFGRFLVGKFCMFNNQFSQLEVAIQRLVSENQQLTVALAHSQQLVQQKQDELDSALLQAMEQEELQVATAQRLEALLALFPAKAQPDVVA